jgi:membrane protein YdbS with pleckstrin-like domain
MARYRVSVLSSHRLVVVSRLTYSLCLRFVSLTVHGTYKEPHYCAHNDHLPFVYKAIAMWLVIVFVTFSILFHIYRIFHEELLSPKI